MSEFVFNRECLAIGDFNLGSNVSLAKIKQDQKLIEENEKLKTEKEVLLESYTALEWKVEQTAQELQVWCVQWLVSKVRSDQLGNLCVHLLLLVKWSVTSPFLPFLSSLCHLSSLLYIGL